MRSQQPELGNALLEMILLDSAYKFIMEVFFFFLMLTFSLSWLMQSCCNFPKTSLKLRPSRLEDRSKNDKIVTQCDTYNNTSLVLSNSSHINYHITSHCVAWYHLIAIVLNCPLLIVLNHTFLCSVVSHRLDLHCGAHGWRRRHVVSR